MAPRKPKTDDDSHDETDSLASEVLKPKTAKAKVTKTKVEKAKVDKVKVEKVKKAVAAKDGVEKVKKEPATAKKEPVAKDAAAASSAKEKVKAVTGEEAMKVMEAYLKEQNRPYSATEVSANLHGKVTKTVADKLLKEMEAAHRISGKATKKDGGGQWVFWSIQDEADSASPEELAAMDEAITALKESLPALKSTHKTLLTKLNAIRNAPTTAELTGLIAKLQVENQQKADKLKGYKDGTIKMMTKEEVDRVEAELKKWRVKRKKRFSAFRTLFDMVMDGCGKKKEDLYEELGLDEDPYKPVA